MCELPKVSSVARQPNFQLLAAACACARPPAETLFHRRCFRSGRWVLVPGILPLDVRADAGMVGGTDHA